VGIIDDAIKFNGFMCLRPSAMKRLQVPAPYAEFVEDALRKRKEQIRRKPNITLDTLPDLLKSVNLLFPLVTVYRERVVPDECWIGKVLDVTKKYLFLLEIGADAIWDEKPSKLLLREITRIDFGGGYEEALHLVGGNPKRPTMTDGQTLRNFMGSLKQKGGPRLTIAQIKRITEDAWAGKR
jgi:hypothetical protein